MTLDTSQPSPIIGLTRKRNLLETTMPDDPKSTLSAEERKRLFNGCVRAIRMRHKHPAREFDINALQLDIPAQVEDWATFIIIGAQDGEHCQAFLTSSDIAELRRERLRAFQEGRLFPDAAAQDPEDWLKDPAGDDAWMRD
jgi:hypothetical protein